MTHTYGSGPYADSVPHPYAAAVAIAVPTATIGWNATAGMLSKAIRRNEPRSADAAAATSSTSSSNCASPGRKEPSRQMSAPAPANSAAVRAIIARVAGVSTAVLRRVPPAQPLAEGRIHAPPLAYCESSKPGVTLWPVGLYRQNAGRVDPESRSSCAHDRAGSTS